MLAGGGAGGGNPVLDPDESSPYAVFAAAAKEAGSADHGRQPASANGSAVPAASANGDAGAAAPDFNGVANPYGQFAV